MIYNDTLRLACKDVADCHLLPIIKLYHGTFQLYQSATLLVL